MKGREHGLTIPATDSLRRPATQLTHRVDERTVGHPSENKQQLRYCSAAPPRAPSGIGTSFPAAPWDTASSRDPQTAAAQQSALGGGTLSQRPTDRTSLMSRFRSQARDSLVGFVLLILFATLQVLIFTQSFLATAIAFGGSFMLGLLGIALVAFFAQSEGGSDEPPVADEPWSFRQYLSTIVVFALSFTAASLRTLGIPGWIWIPVAILGTSIVVAGLVARRHQP